MTEQRKRKGCFFYFLIIGGVMLVTLAIGMVLGLRYGKQLMEQLTDLKPVPLPQMTLPAAELDAVRERSERFGNAILEGRPVEPLTLTADEINAFIATDPQAAAFRDRLYVSVNGDRLGAQMSIPTEELGLDSLRGRYVNATGTFDVALKDGTLWVTIGSLSAKGRGVPETLTRRLRSFNLAGPVNSNPEASRVIGKLQDVQVKDGKVVLIPAAGGVP